MSPSSFPWRSIPAIFFIFWCWGGASGSVVDSEDYFRVQIDRPPIPSANTTNRTLLFDLVTTPSGVLMVNGTLDDEPTFFLLRFEDSGTVEVFSGSKKSAFVSTDDGTTDQSEDDFTANHSIGDSNETQVQVSLQPLDRRPDAAILGVALPQRVVASLGLATTPHSFSSTLLEAGLVDSPFVSICFFNQFINFRSQIFFGEIPAFLTDPPHSLIWLSPNERTWEIPDTTVTIKSGSVGSLPVRLDFSRRGVTLDPQSYSLFLSSLHQNGFVCRPEFDGLRCFSRYLFRSARFPSIEIDLPCGNFTEKIIFNGEFLLFNDDEQLQDGIYKLDVMEGSAEEVVLGNSFLNQFAIVLDLRGRRLGVVDVSSVSSYLFRNFRSQLYLNRVVFVTLVAFVIAIFLTKVLRVSEEGTDTFEFFSPQIMD